MFAISIVVALAAGCSPPGPTQAEQLEALSRQIMTADYEGDRAALDRLYAETDAFLADKSLESRARYWKGYTKWRRAMNGANEKPMPTDLAADCGMCAEEMRLASVADPNFIDAWVGEMSCVG